MLDFYEVVSEQTGFLWASRHSAKTAEAVAAAFDTSMISFNHHGYALPEVPFEEQRFGVGLGRRSETIEAYPNTKFVSQAGI
jgi:succinate-semialdehyde dehydrogenase / glutarate-semialdehyde dehydrogenase